jgi:hypothetical protein
MALTKIKADGLTADLIDETKLADNSIDSEHYNDGSIDTAHIADDQITNAKVNSSAAIAGSKIAPDFGSQNVVSTGTSNALGTTTIKGGSNAAARLLLQNTTSVRTNYIGLSGDDDRIVIAADDAGEGSNSTIDFKVDGSERMRIDSSGSVNIGSTGGFDSNGDDLTITNSSHGGISIKTGTTSDGVLRFGDGSGTDEYRGYINYRHDGDKFLIGTSGTQRLSIDSDGLKFGSDTAAANALSDYEVGNYSPVGTGGTSTTSVTFHSDEAKLSYVKVGQMVTVFGRVRINANNYDGTFQLSLPFASASGDATDNVSMSAVGTHGFNFDNDGVGAGHNMGLFWETAQNASIMYLLVTRDDAGWLGATSGYLLSGTYLGLNHTYKAAA